MENFTDEQNLAFEKYINGENVFITGPGGSGKSHLIRHIYSHAESENKNVKVCAMTGCAAILLQCKATTLHSFAGIGLANKPIEEVLKTVFEKRHKLKNWRKTDILILDEVSMMSLKLLIILDKIARKVYKNPNIPFGGLQVIFSGDFYQLPPIKCNDEEKEASMFCFESKLWQEIFPVENQIFLKTIFRQSDNKLLKILKYIRRGSITNSTKEMLEKKVYSKEEIDKIIKEKVITILSPIKRDVDNINMRSYSELGDNMEKNVYKIKFVQSGNTKENKVGVITEELNNLLLNSNSAIKNDYEFLANNLMAEKSLELKVGTYVMCIANINLNSENQIANGSQGMVVGFKNGLPLVKFTNINQAIVIDYYTWKSETNKNIAVSQIPLIYAWAITIHKSQGLTLENALIDIGKNIFEDGQTYVALSRVKSLDGLYLSSFDYRKISANPKVKRYYGDG